MFKHLLCKCLLICTISSNVFAFDPPDCGDPWYYQSDNRGIEFMVPDKAQHYYGSYFLTEVTTKYLGDVLGTITAFAFGFMWEIKDSQTSLGTPNGGVIGFSYRDLIADGLGVLSSRINKHPDIKTYVTYDVVDKTISINTSWTF